MKRRSLRFLLLFFSFWVVAGGATWAFAADLIVRTPKPYTAVKRKIALLGGVVKYEFKNANGLAVTIPDSRVAALKAFPEVASAVRDVIVPAPKPREILDLSGEAWRDLASSVTPDNYFPYTSQLTNALPLQEAGFLGQGVVVVIIDSGVSRTASALRGRVIGGESFVPGPTEPDATSSRNDPHGTWVASMIGANAAFGFPHDSALATAVRAYCTPVSLIPCTFDAGGGIDGIPMIGQAPAARFYALKIFPASGEGAPTSRILQAMDRTLELRRKYSNLRVVNMSLGGPTLFAGEELEDELATSMEAAGITLVVSASNAGPSGSTVGSPGTARRILTVGAASSAVHERILREVQYGPGFGSVYRPDGNQQMAYFSSRGPNADGRSDPEVVANGFASFAQGADGAISLVSGTSFSAPTVAGVAALLYSAKPTATPARVRAAIIRSARAGLIPTARRQDQGAGYVNAAGAKALLDTGVSSVADSGPATKSVPHNVLLGANIFPILSPQFTTHISNLRPAERREFYFLVDRDAASVRVTLTNIAPSLPPARQNQLFGDDLLFTVHSAKTSKIGGGGDYLAFNFVPSDRTFLFERPESGLLRVTVNGDWTNAGTISTDLAIEELKLPPARHVFTGTISEGGEKRHGISFGNGKPSVTFRLSWDNDWGSYPTNDLDLIIQGPDGTFYFEGATLNSPETLTVGRPQAGLWKIFVLGFTLFETNEPYTLQVY